MHRSAEFVDALAAARRLVVIGYSFRDAHVNEALRRWFHAAPDGAVLRINRMTDGVPEAVHSWGTRRQVDLQLMPGSAKDLMERLVGPEPGLLG